MAKDKSKAKSREDMEHVSESYNDLYYDYLKKSIPFEEEEGQSNEEL